MLFQLVVSRIVKLILWSGLTIMHEIQGLAFLLRLASIIGVKRQLTINKASYLETVSMRFQWLVGVGTLSRDNQ